MAAVRKATRFKATGLRIVEQRAQKKTPERMLESRYFIF
jgi:hypothetical protein